MVVKARDADRKKKIVVKVEKCAGCRICELICSLSKYGELNPKRSRIRVVTLNRIPIDVPVVCGQCSVPFCIESCPVSALERNSAGGILVNDELCAGCGKCVEACPYGAISIDTLTHTAIACDLCNGQPLCVEWCPTGALTCVSSPLTVQEKRWSTALLLSEPLLKKWDFLSMKSG